MILESIHPAIRLIDGNSLRLSNIDPAAICHLDIAVAVFIGFLRRQLLPHSLTVCLYNGNRDTIFRIKKLDSVFTAF